MVITNNKLYKSLKKIISNLFALFLVMLSQVVKLSVNLRNTRALVIFNPENKNYKVIDCSKKSFCKIYISKNCPPYCEIIVAVKDFVLKRRKPKAEVVEL